MKPINVIIQSAYGPNFTKEVTKMRDIIEAVGEQYDVKLTSEFHVMGFKRSQDDEPVTDHFDDGDYVAVATLGGDV